MIIRRLIFAAAMIALAVFVALQAVSLQTWMRVNKAQYLLNQGKLVEARRHLERLRSSASNDPRVGRISAEILMAQRRYPEALDQLRQLSNSPDNVFLRAVAEYETGNEADAEKLFADLASRANALPQDRRAIVELANCAFTSGTCTVPSPMTQEREGYRMMQASLSGRVFLRSGLFPEAEQQFASAIDLQDANPRTPRLACMASAAHADFPNARLYADRSSSTAVFLQAVREEISAVLAQQSTASLSVQDSAALVRRTRTLRLADTWTQFRIACDSASSHDLDRLLTATREQEDWGHAVPEKLLECEILEAAQRSSEAYRSYMHMFEKHPSYAVLLRIQQMTGGEPFVLKAARDDFLSHFPGLAVYRAEDLKSSSALLIADALAFYKSGDAETVIESPESGPFEIAVVARGDRAFGLSPVMRLSLNGNVIDQFYVAREEWDCYSGRYLLPSGRHVLRLEYLNNSERLLTEEEDRNLYVRDIMIVPAGGM